jgi:Ca2+-binding RTX toxin-like protein
MAIYNGDSGPNVIDGGAGHDEIHGQGGDDQLNGHGDYDFIAGGAGSDTVNGGDGDDSVFAAEKTLDYINPMWTDNYVAPLLDIGSEVDTLQGGDGNDWLYAGYGDNVDGGANSGGDRLYISFLGAPAGVVFDFTQATQVIGGGTIQNVEHISWIQGSNFDDDIYAQSTNDNGLSEFTAIFGMGGDDHLRAGYYTGYMDGGDGNDIVDGRGSSYIRAADGGAGDDIVYISGSLGFARGGDGNDTIYSTYATWGGAGNDTIILSFTPQSGGIALGEAGDDDITAASNAITITGGTGADILRGNSGDDVLVSENFATGTYAPGFDMGLERDVLTGAGGNDTLSIGYGDDADGGTGNDSLRLSFGGRTEGVTFDTAGFVSGQPFLLGGGTIQNIETLTHLRGSNFDDHLTIATQAGSIIVEAGDGWDFIISNGSPVTVYGGAGNDTLSSGAAADYFDGGAGFDTVHFVTAAAGVTVTLAPPGLPGGGGGDTLVDVEAVLGSFFADTITGNDLANNLVGLDGDDTLAGQGGADWLDGMSGADTMRGGTGNDNYYVENAGDVVEENVGEGRDLIFTKLATYSLVALPNVEDLFAHDNNAHDFRGNSGNNGLTGGSGNDIFRLYDGGDDTVFGGIGNDVIFFIGTLTGADVVNGSDGVDTLVLQGPYGSLTLTANVTQIENVSILGGNNTNFGEPGTNRYDYVLTTHDSNFAAGVQARINGAALLEGEDFTFDGSAETNASFVVYGGKGKDTFLGGLGNDIFFFAEERFASGDTVNGGAGYDGMFLRGNHAIDFNAPGYTGLFTNIENLTLTSAADERYARGGGIEFDYSVTLSDAIVGAGQELTVSGAMLMAEEYMTLDGSQETDGRLRLFGGKGYDTLKGGGQADLIHGSLGGDILAGGGGADEFRYQDVAESTPSIIDQILDFTPGTDKVDLSRIDSNSLVAGNQAFVWIGSNAFTGSAGQLRAFISGGTWYVEGDVDGDGSADLFIALTPQGPTPLGAGDFLL